MKCRTLLLLPALLLACCGKQSSPSGSGAPSPGTGKDSITARDQSAANLQNIGKAAIAWAEKHNDRLPESPAAFLVAGVPPERLVSPRIGSAPASISKEDIAALAKKIADNPRPDASEFQFLSQKLEGHVDYEIATKAFPNNLDTPIMIAWEKPQGLKVGINVLFADMHVEFVPFADLPRVIDENNKHRKMMNLPEIQQKDNLPQPL